jgi:hypothetical protein
MAAIGGGEMDIHHLNRREFFEDGARRQSRRQSAGSEFQLRISVDHDRPFRSIVTAGFGLS